MCLAFFDVIHLATLFHNWGRRTILCAKLAREVDVKSVQLRMVHLGVCFLVGDDRAILQGYLRIVLRYYRWQRSHPPTASKYYSNRATKAYEKIIHCTTIFNCVGSYLELLYFEMWLVQKTSATFSISNQNHSDLVTHVSRALCSLLAFTLSARWLLVMFSLFLLDIVIALVLVLKDHSKNVLHTSFHMV